MPKSKLRSKKRNKPKPIKWKSDKELFQVPAKPRSTVEFPRPASNSKTEFTLVPGFPLNHPQSKILRSPLGSHGIYQVTYFLSIPGVDNFKSGVDLGKFSKGGESLLQLPNNESLKIELTSENGKVEMEVLGNSKGIMSRIILRVICNSFVEAEKFAHNQVSTILSYWSYIYDVGLDISGYQIYEENTGSQKYLLGLVGKVKLFDNDKPFAVLPEYQRIFAAYREAMNSSNLFYQLLCFFKVTEGIISLRQKAIKKIRPLRKGEQGFEPDEVFPNDLNLLPVDDEITKLAFSEYLGKNFQDVRNLIKDEFRHSIAHLLEFDNVIDADRYEDITKCAKAIPVIKFIARKMLENNLNKLANNS
jgi:hypothetical protein